MRRAFASSVALLLVIGASSLFLRASSVLVPSGAWAPTGDISGIRAGAAAVLLSDGVVLMAGGSGPEGRVASAERYNVIGGTFIATAAMRIARANHTATSLDGGRVLVIGGFGADGTVVGGAEIYDPATNSWTPAGTLTHARAGHTATLLPDGRVLVAGGENAEGALASMEVYSPVYEEFALVAAPMTAARMRHAAAVAGDKVLLIGGWNGTAALSSVDVYDPATNSVSAGPAMRGARAEHTATTLLNGNVLVAGGMTADGELRSAEVFDAVSGEFAPTASAMITARRNHIALLLPHNNSVLLAGGWSDGAASATAELYRAWQDGGIFVPTGSSAAPRSWSAGSALSFAASATNRSGPADGLVLVAGGEGASSAELYGFATVKTDKDDYSPGMTVRVSGSGWQPSQPVTFFLRELPAEHYARLFTIEADAGGNIGWTDLFLVEQHHLGVHFLLTAGDGVSQAQTAFTDGNRVTFSTTAAGAELTNFGTLTLNQCMSVFVQERQGSPIDPTHVARLVSLTSVPSGITFFSGPSCGGSSITSITIPANQSAIQFSFRSALAGNYTIKGDGGEAGSNNATASVIIGTANRMLTITGTGAGAGTVTSDVGGISCSIANGVATGTCSASIADGTLVTLTANPSTTAPAPAGSTFSAWSGDGSGTSTRIVAMDAAKSVNAHFAANQIISVTSAAPASAAYGSNFVVSATGGGSGNPVLITTAGVCSGGGSGSATITMTSGVGSCVVHYNQAGNSSFNPAAEVTNGTNATKATAIVTVTGYSGTYDAAAHGATGAATGVDAAGAALGTNLDLGDTFTDAPGGTATWTFAGGTNYSDQSGTVAIIINKANATVTITGYTGTYDGAAHGATGTVTGVDANGTAAGTTLNLGASFTSVPGGAANWTLAGGTNYNDQSGSVPIVISKANATVTVTGFTGVYDGAPHAATGSVSGVDAGGAAEGTTLNLGASFINFPGGTANWTFAGGTNYNNQSGAVLITINKATPIVMVSFGPSPIMFDGNPHPAAVTVTGVSGPLAMPADGTLSTTYTRNTLPFPGIPTLVGTYTAAVSFTSTNVNYTNAASTTPASLTILTVCSAFNGFFSPIGGNVELGTGGSLIDPVRAFKLNSTIPVKFSATCYDAPLMTGIQTLKAIKYSSAGTPDAPIDATPTDAATTGNEFRLNGTEWHFNLSTKALPTNAQGIWLLETSLFDGSTYTVWVEIKR